MCRIYLIWHTFLSNDFHVFSLPVAQLLEQTTIPLTALAVEEPTPFVEVAYHIGYVNFKHLSVFI